ncbi:hypothetical protein TNIN_405641 [Trichonephila inaurata madagascariensis]|uniref:Uncharacterized protein n=1 Tax=Trichonephila inaurata madagascariensis TaxID=2747483 RepID=A0A8X6Y5S2_9ARAC|nr:hypothetical protein TNIN_405641 [Trichonephila inaurata madagascariensis]
MRRSTRLQYRDVSSAEEAANCLTPPQRLFSSDNNKSGIGEWFKYLKTTLHVILENNERHGDGIRLGIKSSLNHVLTSSSSGSMISDPPVLSVCQKEKSKDWKLLALWIILLLLVTASSQKMRKDWKTLNSSCRSRTA